MFNAGQPAGRGIQQQQSSQRQPNTSNQQEMGSYYQQPIPYYEQPHNQPGNWYNQPQNMRQHSSRPQPLPFRAMNQPFVWANVQPSNNDRARRIRQEVPKQSMPVAVQQPIRHVQQPKQATWGKEQLNSYGKGHLNHPPSKSTIKREQEMKLSSIVKEMFEKYDFDGSGTLDKDELVHVFNDILARFGIGIVLQAAQAQALLYEIDKNSDGSISPEELYQCVKNLVLNEMSDPHDRY